MSTLRILTTILSLSICTNTDAMSKKQPEKMHLKTQGVHHVGLSVENVNVTSKFFIDALGFKKVGERKKYPAIFVSDGSILVTLWQVQDKKKTVNFDRKNNIGLHHLALKLNTFKELDAMYLKLKDWPGVKFDFSPELMGEGPTKHMMFYEPGGIRLELATSGKN